MAYVGYKRTIQLDFNYDAVKQGVPKVNQQMALLNSEFNKSVAQVNATGSAMDKLTLTNQKLGNQVQLQKDKVSTLQKELDKLTTSETKNERAIASKRIELNNAQAQLTRLQTAYSASNQEVEKSKTLFGQAKLELENFRLGAERAGINLDSLKTQFVGVTTAIVAFVAGTTKAYMSFEESMIKSRTIMDENSVSYEKMTKDVENMSNKYGISAKEMAEANYQILSAAIDTADANKVLEQSSILAKTGFTDVATAADILTSIMNGYQLSVEDASTVVDQLIKTQKVGKLTIGELSSSMGDLIGIASSVNVPITEVEASIAAMTQSGVKADTAITNMKQILSAIANPTSSASEAAKKYGISMDAASISSEGFANWLEKVLKKTKGNSAALGEMFGNVKSWSGMVNLAKNNGKAFSDALDQISDSAGSADEALGLVENTTNSKLTNAVNHFKTSLITLGEKLSPIVEFVAKLVDLIASIPAPVTLAVVAFTSVAKILGIVSTAMVALGAGGGIAASGLAAIGLAGGISLPVILAIAAAIALVVAMIALLNGSSATKGIKNAQEACNTVSTEAATKVNSMNSKKGYATGTQFVREDGDYTVGENGPETVYLRRGQRVDNASQTRKNESKVDMSETNSLLKTLVSEFDGMKKAYQEQPRQIQRLYREGGTVNVY